MSAQLENECAIEQQGDGMIAVITMPDSDIDRLDYAMLTTNRVPGLLPVTLHVQDREARLEYELGKRKPLLEWLRMHDVAESSCLHFMLHITNTLCRLSNYLLCEKRCVLRLERMFIGDHLLDVRMMYRPSASGESKQLDLTGDLQRICLQLTRHSPEHHALRQIVYYLDDPSFHLQGLRRRLINLIDQQESELAVNGVELHRSEYGPEDSTRQRRRWLPSALWRNWGRKRPTKEAPKISHHTLPVHPARDKAGDASLAWTEDGSDRQEVPIASTPFIIGRDRHIADWSVDHSRLSRIHAEIKRTPSGYVVRDLGSSNGTYHNGNRLTPFTDYSLRDGDTIDCAGICLQFLHGMNKQRE